MSWTWTELGGVILDRPAFEPLTRTVVVRGTNNALAWRGLAEDSPWRLVAAGFLKIVHAPAVCMVGEDTLALAVIQQVRHSPIQQLLKAPWDAPCPMTPGQSGELLELGGWLCDGPALAQYSPLHGYQDIVGRGGDNVYYFARGGASISRDAWRPIPNGHFSSAPSIAHRNPIHSLDQAVRQQLLCARPEQQRVEVVGRGLDNLVYHATLTAGTWSAWAPIGDLRAQFAPAIASLSDDELFAFAVGTDGRLHTSFRASDRHAWTPWRELEEGPACTSGPAVARIGERELALVVRGEAANVVVGRATLLKLPSR